MQNKLHAIVVSLSIMYIVGRLSCSHHDCTNWASIHCGACWSPQCPLHRSPTNQCSCGGKRMEVFVPSGPVSPSNPLQLHCNLVLGDHPYPIVPLTEANAFFEHTLCHCCNEQFGGLQGFFLHYMYHGDEF